MHETENADTNHQTVSDTPAKKPLYWLVPHIDGREPSLDSIPIWGAEELNRVLLPVKPLYDLETAAALIPIAFNTLVNFLSRHRKEYPARYRKTYRRRSWCKIRLLTADEIHRIRQYYILGPAKADAFK